jgi:hypothetical protein
MPTRAIVQMKRSTSMWYRQPCARVREKRSCQQDVREDMMKRKRAREHAFALAPPCACKSAKAGTRNVHLQGDGDEWRVGASDHGKYHRLVQTIQKLGPWRPPKRVVNRATRQHTHEAESVHPQRTNSLSKIQSRVTPRHRIRREVSIHASPKTLPGMKTLASKVLSSMALFTAFHSQGHTYPAYKQAQRKQKNRTFWSSGCARATAKIVRKHQKPHGTPMACTTASAMSSPRVLSSINSGIGRFVLGESVSTTSKLDQKTLQLQSASQAPPSFLS